MNYLYILIYLYSPFPSAVDRIYRRIEQEKVLHVEQREMLTAIAAGQVMIRSPVMESGGLLALLRSAAAGESWESGGEWEKGAVRGGEANNCRRFGKQCGFSSVAARVQPPPPTCTARAWPWRNCRFERSEGTRPRSALSFVPCGPNSKSRRSARARPGLMQATKHAPSDFSFCEL